jgi:hypothetical protein
MFFFTNPKVMMTTSEWNSEIYKISSTATASTGIAKVGGDTTGASDDKGIKVNYSIAGLT